MPRVLIVDDERAVRATLADVLRAAGYNVSVARSGFEAIEIAAALAVDVILLDVYMPSMDGWTTLERLRTTRPAAVVVMTSGRNHADLAAICGTAFLEKPYRRSALLREIALATGDEPGEPSRRAA